MYSVVIPLYNHAQYIEACISSVLTQTIPAAEIIVIDDGSYDNSHEVVQGLAASYPQIIYWRQKNRGAHFTINAGLHRATSEFVAILNSDDLFESTRMESCLDLLNSRQNVDAVATELSFINELGRSIRNPWYDHAISGWKKTKNMIISLLNANFLMTTSNLDARHSLFERVGYFSPLRYAHDLEFFVRALRTGAKIEFLSQKLLKYRMHSTNTINENHNKVRVEWAAIIASYGLSLTNENSIPNYNSTSSQELLSIIREHRLSGLVNYLTKASLEIPRGFSLFNHPDWPKIAERALEFDV
jgi:glycosyltransferase involved in cell wall biosynthesis